MYVVKAKNFFGPGVHGYMMPGLWAHTTFAAAKFTSKMEANKAWGMFYSIDGSKKPKTVSIIKVE